MIDLSIKILIVEDNPADAELIAYHTKKIVNSPVVHITYKFEDTAKIIQIVEPDIILSDYQLKSYNGLEILYFISENQMVIPIVFITGTVNNKELAPHAKVKDGNGLILKEHMSQLQSHLMPYLNNLQLLKFIKKMRIEENKPNCSISVEHRKKLESAIQKIESELTNV
ncbi:response regulator [Flammeovirga sp. MY04]|uniref:response regulator n=1 Tax=Flammeovirga sp. MY04 TaxID=1191459 RepID=UPI0008061C2F|nr:response regulator [Flammeovirga sp. MY04]ANQ49067.1 response regulator [Flammeovirga sp. MY04]